MPQSAAERAAVKKLRTNRLKGIFSAAPPEAAVKQRRRNNQNKRARVKRGAALNIRRTNYNAATQPATNFMNQWCSAAFNIYVGLLPEGSRSRAKLRQTNFVQLFKNSSILRIKNNINFTRNLNLNNTQLLDFFVHMWLDGIHDNYISYNFRYFLVEIKKTIFLGADAAIEEVDNLAAASTSLATYEGLYFKNIFGYIATSGTRGQQTDLVDKIIKNISNPANSNLDPVFSKNWEAYFKKALNTKYQLTSTGSGDYYIKQENGKNNSIYLNIDEENGKRGETSLTRLVPNNNENINNRAVYNIETIGTLLDPGTTMIPLGSQNILQTISYNDTRTKVKSLKSKFYFAPFKFIIQGGVLDLDCKLDVTTGNIVVMANGNTLDLPTTKKNAGKNSKSYGVTQFSKYMGDGLQYMITSMSVPIRKITKRTPNGSQGFTYFCSGDSMALIGYDLMCSLSGNKFPRFIADGHVTSAPGIYYSETQFERDGFAVIYRNVAPGGGTILTLSENNKNGTVVEENTGESSGPVRAATVRYQSLINALQNKNNALISNIPARYKRNLFGTTVNNNIAMRLNSFSNAKLNELKRITLNENAKTQNFKNEYNKLI